MPIREAVYENILAPVSPPLPTLPLPDRRPRSRILTSGAIVVLGILAIVAVAAWQLFDATGNIPVATATPIARQTPAATAAVSGIAPTLRPTVAPSATAPARQTATVPVGSAQSSQTLPTVTAKRFVVANTDGVGVNLRDKPDPYTGLIVTNVPEGTEVQSTGPAVDGYGGTYYPVQVGNLSGFIRSDFLKAVS